MLGIPVGLLYSNASEWLVHKYILHGLGRRKDSLWSFHWHEHHRNARQNDMVDKGYLRPLGQWEWNAQTKEALALLASALAHAPLFPIFPFFTATVWYSQLHYYRVHKRAHLDPQWAEEHLPWHADHHLGPDQDANWCVTRPWFDLLMGTRLTGRPPKREAARTA